MRTCVRDKTADDLTHISCLSIPDVTSLASLARWVLPCARCARECPLGARWVYNKAPPLFTLGLCLQHVGCKQSPKRWGQSGKGARCAPLGLFIGYGVHTKGARVGSSQGRWRALGKSLKCCPRSLARPRPALYPCTFCKHPYA